MKLSLILFYIAAWVAHAQELASSWSPHDTPGAGWDPTIIASPAEWTAAREKGDRLICRMEATDEAAGRLWEDTRTPPSARSRWADTSLVDGLARWNWFSAEYDESFHCNFSDDDDGEMIYRIGTAILALGLNNKPRVHGGDNVCYNVQHYDETLEDQDEQIVEPEGQYYEVDGKEYRCTGAHVRFAVNQRGGMIIGLDFQGPRVEAQHNWGYDPRADELPQLQRVSDVVMPFWRINNPNPKNLNYYIVHNIQNKLTLGLITIILKNHNLDKVPHWPGVVANMWNEEGPALIGSPMGGTLAFLLAQHKEDLGNKHVTEVVIFRDDLPEDSKPSVQLLFKIKDVPEPAPDPDAMLDVESGQALKMRSAVLKGEQKNKIRVHKIFQDTRPLIGVSAR